MLLDEQDEPLLPAMLYTDPRGADQCDRIAKLVGTERIIRQTGVAPAPMYSLPKLMWVKENRPEIWCRVKRICLMEDYIVYLLSGTVQIDYSLATRTMAFDIHRLCWAEEILNVGATDGSRTAYAPYMREKGFDICENAKRLCEYYEALGEKS